MRQLGPHKEYDSLVLACDVGGTNTTIALVGRVGTRFDILERRRYGSQSLPSMEDGLARGLSEIDSVLPGHIPEEICISGAGPVHENRCTLSNVSWTIDGNAIATRFSIPTRVINDFLAISYGIPLLDVSDPDQITALRSAASTETTGTVQAVVGAGTGLGVGYLVERGGRYVALPSEGGHAAFAPYDELSSELASYITKHENVLPGAELFVSGQGLAWAYRFFRDTGRVATDSPLHTGSTPDDPAAVVSKAALEGDSSAREIMRLFVRNYARVASDAALHFLPTNGLFLAGGIVTKNEGWFIEDDRFIELFTTNYRSHIADLLRTIPVYIVKDYAISLYGAAHAAYALGAEEAGHG